MEETQEEKAATEQEEAPETPPEETQEAEQEEQPATDETAEEEPGAEEAAEEQQADEPDAVEADPAAEDEDDEEAAPPPTPHTRPEPTGPKKRKKVDLASPLEKLHQRACALSGGSLRDRVQRQSAGGRATDGESGQQYSSGLILGVAIIVISLVAGIALVRLHGKVNTLENRVQALEQALSETSTYAMERGPSE